MSYLDHFIIPFSGLKPGLHEYTFDIDDAFFAHFEYSEIKSGRLTVDLLLDKQENMLVLQFTIRGSLHIMCDRCLDYFDQPVNGTERLLVKFGESAYEETDEIVVIPTTEHRFNVSHFIYEYIHLLLPYKRVHPNEEDGTSRCNPDFIRRMEHGEEVHEADPRWDELKRLL